MKLVMCLALALVGVNAKRVHRQRKTQQEQGCPASANKFRLGIDAFPAIQTDGPDPSRPSRKLRRTPVMGLNLWFSAMRTYTAETLLEAADALDTEGYKSLGYTYISVDGGWWMGSDWEGPYTDIRASVDRLADNDEVTADAATWTLADVGEVGYNASFLGALKPDRLRFPDTGAFVAALHAKGFHVAHYHNTGGHTCNGQKPSAINGNVNNGKASALQFLAWGIDYLKLDACGQTDPGKGSVPCPGVRDKTCTFVNSFEHWLKADTTLGHRVIVNNCRNSCYGLWEKPGDRCPYRGFSRSFSDGAVKYGKKQEIDWMVPSFCTRSGECASTGWPLTRWRTFNGVRRKKAAAPKWCSEYSYSARTSTDTRPCWSSMINSIYAAFTMTNGGNHYFFYDPDTILVGINAQIFTKASSSPSRYGLSLEESRTHMSLACIMSMPLFIGTDVTLLPPAYAAILKNPAAIFVDQQLVDVAEYGGAWAALSHKRLQGMRLGHLGADGKLYLANPYRQLRFYDGRLTVWAKLLDKNLFGVAVVNEGTRPRSDVVLHLGEIADALRQKLHDAVIDRVAAYTVMDVWANTVRNDKTTLTRDVIEGHQTALFIVQTVCDGSYICVI